MTQARDYVRASAKPSVVHAVAALLRTDWDPRAEFRAPDGELSPDAHARTILAILATGADTANVAGYLRRAEVDTLGQPRSDASARSELANRIWRLLLDAAVADHSLADNAN